MPNDELVEQIAALLQDMPKQRTYLLPALWAVVDALGWVDEDRIRAVAEVLNLPEAEVYGVASFYAMLPTSDETSVRVCDDLLCRLSGSQELIRALKADGSPVVAWPCLGRCDQAPAALAGSRPIVAATPDAVRAVMRGEEG